MRGGGGGETEAIEEVRECGGEGAGGGGGEDASDGGRDHAGVKASVDVMGVSTR